MAVRKLPLLLLLSAIGFPVPGQQGAGPAGGTAPVAVSRATAEELASHQQRSGGAMISSIYSTPRTFTLVPGSAQAHAGKVWLRWTDEGLRIWGEVQAGNEGFRWPEQKSEMLSSDHVEVWLAASREVAMPAVGWGNQFGESTLAKPEDCAKDGEKPGPGDGISDSAVDACTRWYGEQVQYRQLVRRLFVRQWLAAGQGGIAGGSFQKRNSFEDFAATAWAGLTANLFPETLPTALQPKSDDGFVASFDDEVSRGTMTNLRTGYKFNFVIPFSAFPPVPQLKLRDLYVAVDVFSAAPAGRKMGAVSSTAPGHAWGKPETFNHVALTAPAAFSVSPCAYKLEQDDMYGKMHPAWFFPADVSKNADLSSTIALINPAGGYMYEPDGVSPEADVKYYFWKPLADGTTVCGPGLAWRKGSVIRRSKFLVEEKTLVVRALADGWSLVRTGPTMSTHSPFGSGQCGACPIADFDVYAVSPQGEISAALEINQDLSGEFGQPGAADLTISDDWGRVNLFLETQDYTVQDSKPAWSSRTYCLRGYAYARCGTEGHANPPEPAHFPEMRGDQ